MPKKSTERKVRRKSLKVKRKSRRKPKKVKSKSKRKSRRKYKRKSRRKSRRKSSNVKSKSRRKVKRQIKRKVNGKSTYGTRYGGERELVESCFQAESGGGSGYRDLSKIDHIPVVYNIKWLGLGPIKIMFWNIQGTSSREWFWAEEKMRCVIEIVHGHKPDLVYFSEVSNKLIPDFLGENYKLLGSSYELDKNNELGTKDLRCYGYFDGNLAEYLIEKKVEMGKTRLERSGDVRAWLTTKLLYKEYVLEITGLHARASKDGGKSNIAHIINSKINKPSRNISYIFGGDFNLGLDESYDWGYRETFTPEQIVFEESASMAQIIRPITSTKLFNGGTQQSGKILDYILVSSDIEAEALAPW